jgi:manganese transport protein
MKAVAPFDPASAALPGERSVLRAAHEALSGQRRGLRALLPFLGPAFIASVAYVDPGNFATNVQGGARYGYMLIWVVIGANLTAMLVQSLSAKLGIATGRNLPEVCRDRFPRSVSRLLWVQAELIAMATDLAEFLGAALGINLVFGIPLLPAAAMTGLAAFGILALQSRGFRPLEAVIAVLVGVIVVAFAFEVFLARPSAAGIASGFLPTLDGPDSILLAVGIIGATVMPHVVYLHSALTQQRVVGGDARERKAIYRFERWDVVIAMAIAGVVNCAMLITAAAVFHSRGLDGLASLPAAYHDLGRFLGHGADVLFGLGLLASGLSSSSVGTMAGQVVMAGFIRRQIPLFLRRTLTMLPALVVIGMGADLTHALVLSQVVLSFGLPFALIPLVLFCRDRGLMGDLVNSRAVTALASVVVAVIVSLNVFLLYQAALSIT